MVNFFTLNNQGFTTLPIVQANNNVWTGTNTFNTSLPTSTITASTPNELVDKKIKTIVFIEKSCF